jgi:Niemann-Pick C1 protein
VPIFEWVTRNILQVHAQQGIWPGIVLDKPQKCVMHGRCKELDDGRILNCYSNEKPKPIAPEALKNLTNYCSEMIDMYKDLGIEDLCCREDQIADLVGQLGKPEGIIARCPSCWYNFRQSLCELTCSPFQSQFLRVSKFWEDDTGPNGELIIEDINFYITERHANTTFDSCRNVVMGTANSLAMDFLCGPWGSSRCTPQRYPLNQSNNNRK